MKTAKAFFNKLYRLDIRALAILASLCVSLVIFLHQQPFNIDGIGYLRAADAFNTHGLSAALHVYNWPFYSICIALFSKLTHLSLLNSAYILDTILAALTAVMFVLIIKQMGGDKKLQLLGLILLLLYPTFFNFRYSIMRGYGYFFLSLFAIWLLMRYMQKPNWRDAIYWWLATFFAFLFRIEGGILLATIPFVTFLRQNTPFKQKLVYYLQLNTFNIICAFIGLLVIVIFGRHILTTTRLDALLHQVLHQSSILSQHYTSAKQVLQKDLLNITINMKNAGIFYIGGIIWIFLVTTLLTYGFVYLVLTFYGIFHRNHKIGFNNGIVITGYILINIIILLLYTFQNYFLTGRYIMLLAFILMLFTPFGLLSIYQDWRDYIAERLALPTQQLSFNQCLQNLTQQKLYVPAKRLVGQACDVSMWRSAVLPIIAIFFMISTIGLVFDIGPSNTYIIKAGDWIQQHTASNSRLFTDSPKLVFYAKRSGTEYPQDFSVNPNKVGLNMLKTTNLDKYDYYALVVRKKDLTQAKKLVQHYPMKLIKSFENNRGDKVLILQKQQTKTTT